MAVNDEYSVVGIPNRSSDVGRIHPFGPTDLVRATASVVRCRSVQVLDTRQIETWLCDVRMTKVS